jgi:hypothetical protein
MEFAYVAYSKTREKVSGTVAARDKSAAVQAVESLGYVPVSLEPRGPVKVAAARPGGPDAGSSKPPRITAPPIEYSKAELLEIARCQKSLIWAYLLSLFTAGIACFLVFRYIYKFAVALRYKVPWLWVFNPLSFFILNHQATVILRQAGLYVGLMGVSGEELEELATGVKPRRAEAAAWQGPRCVACNAPIETGSTCCPQCKWTQPSPA